MSKRCPHCGFRVSEPWHEAHGLQKLDRGWVEVGIPVVGRLKVHRQAVAVVYVCLMTNLPFLMVLPSAN